MTQPIALRESALEPVDLGLRGLSCDIAVGLEWAALTQGS